MPVPGKGAEAVPVSIPTLHDFIGYNECKSPSFFKKNWALDNSFCLLYEIQSTGSMKEGTCLSPPIATAFGDDDIVPFRGLSHRGSHSSGGETPVSVSLVMVHFLHQKKKGG